jgi:hypothetical protein
MRSIPKERSGKIKDNDVECTLYDGIAWRRISGGVEGTCGRK